MKQIETSISNRGHTYKILIAGKYESRFLNIIGSVLVNMACVLLIIK